MLEKDIKKAIKGYNSHRSPESSAKLVDAKPSGVVIQFSGSFCRSCGVYDCFDDFVIELERKGTETKIQEINQMGDDSYLLRFSPKSGKSERFK